MKGKKGAEKIMSVYWFVILAIVAGAIVIGVMLFYSSVIDIRDLETEILANKIIDCVAKGGVIEGVLDKDFDLIKNCNLNFEDSDYERNQYYVGVKIYDFAKCDSADCGDVIKKVEVGRSDFVAICNDDKTFPVCKEKSIYSTGGKDNQYLINILVGVRKTEKNVKL